MPSAKGFRVGRRTQNARALSYQEVSFSYHPAPSLCVPSGSSDVFSSTLKERGRASSGEIGRTRHPIEISDDALLTAVWLTLQSRGLSLSVTESHAQKIGQAR